MIGGCAHISSRPSSSRLTRTMVRPTDRVRLGRGAMLLSLWEPTEACDPWRAWWPWARIAARGQRRLIVFRRGGRPERFQGCARGLTRGAQRHSGERATSEPLRRRRLKYAQSVASGEPDQGEIAAALRAIHEGLVRFPGSLPPFSLERHLHLRRPPRQLRRSRS
jgi:hypothetical protein